MPGPTLRQDPPLLVAYLDRIAFAATVNHHVIGLLEPVQELVRIHFFPADPAGFGHGVVEENPEVAGAQPSEVADELPGHLRHDNFHAEDDTTETRQADGWFRL